MIDKLSGYHIVIFISFCTQHYCVYSKIVFHIVNNFSVQVTMEVCMLVTVCLNQTPGFTRRKTLPASCPPFLVSPKKKEIIIK